MTTGTRLKIYFQQDIEVEAEEEIDPLSASSRFKHTFSNPVHTNSNALRTTSPCPNLFGVKSLSFVDLLEL